MKRFKYYCIENSKRHALVCKERLKSYHVFYGRKKILYEKQEGFIWCVGNFRLFYK